VAQQLAGVVVVGDRDADAGAYPQQVAVRADRLDQRVQEALGDLGGDVGPGVGKQYREFVAAQPGRRVAGTHAGAQPLRDRDQHRVADVGVSAVHTPCMTMPTMAGAAAARLTGASPLRTSLPAANAAAMSSAVASSTSTSCTLSRGWSSDLTVTVHANTAAATSTVVASNQNRSFSWADRAAIG
jgi:hypothetical protein